jgi:hypothetical protein
MRSKLLSAIAVVMLMPVLAATSCVPDYVVGPLPDPDQRLNEACNPGRPVLGEDAVTSTRRKELARRCEAGKRAAWSAFYAGLQANRSKSK